MKKQYILFTLLAACWTFSANAQQRYIDPIYTESDIEVSSDIVVGTNIDFLTSTTSNAANVGRDITEIRTALGTGQPIPGKYYNPGDASSDLKVTEIKMDVYRANSTVDATTDRPVIIFLHTGNFLPPGLNGSPLGFKGDSTAIVLCTEWAKRGYVAAAVNYRLGWNPLAASAEVRRGQLLNAVYRAIHDVKQTVRFMRNDAAGGNTYSIDPDRISLYGEGTGGYVALAYATLDKNEEMELEKFRAGGVGPSYIDRATVGEIDGSGGALNLYAQSTTSSEINAVITAGGALADTSWLETGDAPMIAFQAVRDPFAPFGEGTVIVPTTNEDVVDVQGANLYIQKAVAVGNNAAFEGILSNDAYTIAARANYGAEVDYIYAAPFDKITINSEVDGLFPVIRPVADQVLNNEGSPWQFWDPESALAKTVVGEFMGQPVTAHMNSIGSNPGMGSEKGRTYIDTILGYSMPRLAVINGEVTVEALSTKQVLPSNATSLYPNPATNSLTVSVAPQYTVTAIEIVDLTGRNVLTLAPSNLVTANLSELQSGYYFVNITTDAGTISNKLLKN